VAHGLGGKQNRRRYDSTSQGLRAGGIGAQRRTDSAVQRLGALGLGGAGDRQCAEPVACGGSVVWRHGGAVA